MKKYLELLCENFVFAGVCISDIHMKKNNFKEILINILVFAFCILDFTLSSVAAPGIISTVAGTGEKGFSGDGGKAAQAKLNFPRAIFVDSLGNLLIADEPTSNLDVTIQAQILGLISDLKKEFKSSILFITHDLGVVAEMCDRVAVMYAGTICEIAKVKELFKNPLHPYTRALLNAVPREGTEKLESIKGNVPNLICPPAGCRFHPRCPVALQMCSQAKPPLLERGKGHLLACHYYGSEDR